MYNCPEESMLNLPHPVAYESWLVPSTDSNRAEELNQLWSHALKVSYRRHF